MVGVAAGGDLRLVAEAAKSARVDHTIAVSLKVVAKRMRRLGIAAPARILDAPRELSQHGASVTNLLVWVPHPSSAWVGVGDYSFTACADSFASFTFADSSFFVT